MHNEKYAHRFKNENDIRHFLNMKPTDILKILDHEPDYMIASEEEWTKTLYEMDDKKVSKVTSELAIEKLEKVLYEISYEIKYETDDFYAGISFTDIDVNYEEGDLVFELEDVGLSMANKVRKKKLFGKEETIYKWMKNYS